jgi:hypothetical protein
VLIDRQPVLTHPWSRAALASWALRRAEPHRRLQLLQGSRGHLELYPHDRLVGSRKRAWPRLGR